MFVYFDFWDIWVIVVCFDVSCVDVVCGDCGDGRGFIMYFDFGVLWIISIRCDLVWNYLVYCVIYGKFCDYYWIDFGDCLCSWWSGFVDVGWCGEIGF